MSIMSALIPAPYRWLLWLAAVAVIAGVGAWGGHKATQAYYQPKIEKLEIRAKAAEDPTTSICASVWPPIRSVTAGGEPR